MKACTDLKQSKRLAKILPPESADMYWSRCTITDFGNGELKVSYAVEPCNLSQFKNTDADIPCWSLTALLSLLKRPTLHQTNDGKWYCDIIDNRTYFSKHYDNPVDALYEMILKLHEQKSK